VPSGTRKSLPGHLASTLGTLYVDRRQHFPSASTKMPPPVDKNHLPVPNFHKKHPVRGQAATFPLRIHKNAPACGQMPPPGTELPRWAPCTWTGGNVSPPHPQKCPCPWTKATSGHRTSTLGTSCVDKKHLRAPDFHAGHPVRGQAATFPFRVHKNAPACRQKSPPGTKLPRQAPCT